MLNRPKVTVIISVWKQQIEIIKFLSFKVFILPGAPLRYPLPANELKIYKFKFKKIENRLIDFLIEDL